VLSEVERAIRTNQDVSHMVAVTPDGSTAWVAHSNADTISVVHLKSWEVTGHLVAGKEPDGMAYSPR